MCNDYTISWMLILIEKRQIGTQLLIKANPKGIIDDLLS